MCEQVIVKPPRVRDPRPSQSLVSTITQLHPPKKGQHHSSGGQESITKDGTSRGKGNWQSSVISSQKREENQRHLLWANQNPHLAVESMMLSLEKKNLYPSGSEKSEDAVAAVKAENCRCVSSSMPLESQKCPITSSPPFQVSHKPPSAMTTRELLGPARCYLFCCCWWCRFSPTPPGYSYRYSSANGLVERDI